MRRYELLAARGIAIALASACIAIVPVWPAPEAPGPAVPTTPESTAPTEPAIAGPEEPEQETEGSGLLPFSLRGSFATGWQLVGGDTDSSKFNEYREVPNGLYLRRLLLIGETQDLTRFFEFRGRDIRERDQFAQIRLGKYGGQQLLARFDRIPHNYSNTGQLLFRESGPGLFTLPAQVRTDFRAISTTDTDPNTPGTQIDRDAFGDLVNGLVAPVDLELRRRQTTVRWLGNFSPDLTATASYGSETYRGERPIGTTFGFTNQNELPEPLQYRINDVRAGVDYSWGRGAVSLEATHNGFNNAIKALTWNNPLQVTDAVGAPSRGQLALPPDNSAFDVTLSGAMRLTRIATLTGVLSRGQYRQNDAFLPFTVNSALTPPALPASSLDGEIDTSLFNFNLNVVPAPIVSLRAFFRQYNNDNETPRLTFPGSVMSDVSVDTDPIETHPVGYQKINTGIDTVVDVARRLSLTLLADREVWHRQFRDVSRTRENRLGIGLDYRPQSWLSVRGTLRQAHRRITGVYDPNPLQIPTLRKFDEADRNRNEASLILRASTPDGRWDGTLTYTRAHDRYPRSLHGLTRSDIDNFTVEAGYVVNARTSLFAGWAPERIVYDMNSRFRPVTAGNVVDDPANDWSSTLSDHVQTYWLGVNHTLVPDRLDLGLSVTSSVSKGRITSFGVPGGSPAGEPPPLPDTRFSLFEPALELRYQVGSGLTTAFGYRLESYRERDFAQDIMQPYLPGTDAPLSTWLGARQPDYTAHIFTLEARRSF